MGVADALTTNRALIDPIVWLGKFERILVSRIAPKPMIARVVQTWDVPPGLKIALVEDVEKCVWIVESCPVGTQFWTLAQAQELPQSGRTGHALRAAVAAGDALLAAREPQPVVPMTREITAKPAQPIYREERRPLSSRESVVRPLRRASRRERVAVCA